MVTTRPPKTIVKPTALGPVANTDTKLLIYGLFQKGRVLAQDGNVNGIRACVRRGFVDFLDRSGADILGVQEVRALPEEIPLAARTPTDWHAVFAVAERRGYSGVGIYSKFQPVLVETSPPRINVTSPRNY